MEETAAALTRMVETGHVALFASNMVIGEAYVAMQHHYGVGKTDAKAGLHSVLTAVWWLRRVAMRCWTHYWPRTVVVGCSIG